MPFINVCILTQTRNLTLTQNGFKEPRHTSTGTTIVGVKFKDGVILGADTRATAGTIVADKNCEKIHYLAPNIWYTGYAAKII